MRQAVPKVSDALIARLRRLHEGMVDEPYSVDWVDRNRVFHMAVYETAASPRLAAIIRNLQDASVMYIGASLKHKTGLRDEANHGHADILDALENRDTEAAVKALDEHLKTSVNAFEMPDQS
jgi:DNA-binding GntR family transcriptional regulator